MTSRPIRGATKEPQCIVASGLERQNAAAFGTMFVRDGWHRSASLSTAIQIALVVLSVNDYD
jgi:hypothetical protein